MTAWPILKHYDQNHLAHIAMPIGGIGTGTVSLGGRGDLRDWEIMNRPAKGFVPGYGPRHVAPFFALHTQTAGKTTTRALEGPLDTNTYEGASGSTMPNHGLPRFRHATFSTAYPLAQVHLSDADVPLHVRLEAFNPLIPANANDSGIPIAVLRYVLTNRTTKPVTASICGSMPNFIGNDGVETLAKNNRNRFRKGKHVQGILMDSTGVDPNAATWGTMALTTTHQTGISHRVAWKQAGWGTSLLDFWDDFSTDGQLETRSRNKEDIPMASLSVRTKVPARSEKTITFFITWHFPNRITWTPSKENCCGEDNLGNHYATVYQNAWDVAEKTAQHFKRLEAQTLSFVTAFCTSNLPNDVKEAALFNVSTLRTQTCFRTPDGRLYGFEGYNNHAGCCLGSCTHVWNYEQTTAFLFGDLSRTMRDVEFNYATRKDGMMSFRVHLPLDRAQNFGKAAADGQMGCIVKAYRDWQLCGRDDFLKSIWPNVKKAVAFCWIKGGWDSDKDGVMEGCQHNTMDVEYYGPNPQMELWYLSALRAAEEMALYMGDIPFATTCRQLFNHGRNWTDKHLFNGQYYEHEVRPPKHTSDVASSLRLHMGTSNLANPDYQLGNGCLVDQLMGQVMAHICGLGYLANPTHIQKTLRSIFKYNRQKGFSNHFNCMRSYALGNESALLMASYPKGRPNNPFPYFTEIMTGFEYTAAIGMLYEGQIENGLQCITDIRNRYDGQKRSPFNEAECGHHYSRAMIAWAAHLALTGFQYSGVTQTMTFAPKHGQWFWSNGEAWGVINIAKYKKGLQCHLRVLYGQFKLTRFILTGFGEHALIKNCIITPKRAYHMIVQSP